MESRPYILSETNWKEIQNEDFQLAILPWGATEPHNLHLPFGTDNMETEAIAATAASMAWEAGARVLVLPNIPFGVNSTQIEYLGTINLRPSTQMEIIQDVIESLDAQGIRKLLILNGHGGNDFRPMLRELKLDYPDMMITVVEWFKILDLKKYFSEPGDHAGEMETSIMQVLAPHLVLPLEEAGEGHANDCNVEAHNQGWAWTPRDWPRVTSDTGIGNPKDASPEKGQKFLEEVCHAIAGYLVDFAFIDPADFYSNES